MADFESSALRKDEVEEQGGQRRGANSAARRRNVLGRGLNALMSSAAVSVDFDSTPEQGAASGFAEVQSSQADSTDAPSSELVRSAFAEMPGLDDEDAFDGGLVYLALDRVVPNASQPRQHFAQDEISSLSASIKESGLLQPIIVRRLEGQSGPRASFEIVAGERRWRAAKQADLSKIPVIVRHLNDREVLELGIVENVQRADLNPIEEAEAYYRLVSEFGATQEQVAQTVGKDRVSVANALRLLKLPDTVRRMLIEGAISAGHGRALLMLPSAEEQRKAAKRINKEGLSVRALESYVAALKKGDSSLEKAPKKPKSSAGSKSPAELELEDRFRRALGTKVGLSMSKQGKGELRISFFSHSELENLLERLGA